MFWLAHDAEFYCKSTDGRVLTFVIAVIFLIGTPGPGVLSLAGVGAAYGYRDRARYMAGLFIGNFLVAVTVLTGLAAVMLAEPAIRTVLGVASAAYLLWLAYKIAFAGARVAFIERPAPPGIRGGLLLQAINPKAYAVSTAIFANFAFMADRPGLEAALKLLIFNAIWIVLHIFWLWLGVTIRRLDLPPRTQRAINVGMALGHAVRGGVGGVRHGTRHWVTLRKRGQLGSTRGSMTTVRAAPSLQAARRHLGRHSSRRSCRQ